MPVPLDPMLLWMGEQKKYIGTQGFPKYIEHKAKDFHILLDCDHVTVQSSVATGSFRL